MAIVQHDMQLKRSTYEVLQILSISLTDKTPLRELFDKTYSNDVKEQLGPLIPGLFDEYLTRPNFNGTLMLLSHKFQTPTGSSERGAGSLAFCRRQSNGLPAPL